MVGVLVGCKSAAIAHKTEDGGLKVQTTSSDSIFACKPNPLIDPDNGGEKAEDSPKPSLLEHEDEEWHGSIKCPRCNYYGPSSQTGRGGCKFCKTCTNCCRLDGVQCVEKPFTSADVGTFCWLKPGKEEGCHSTQGEKLKLIRFDCESSVQVASVDHPSRVCFMMSQKLQRTNPIEGHRKEAGGASDVAIILPPMWTAGDRIGCRLESSTGKPDGVAVCVVTINGEALGRARLEMPYDFSAVEKLRPAMLLGPGTSASFVAVREEAPSPPKTLTISKASRALVQLDLAVEVAHSICRSLPPPRSLMFSPGETTIPWCFGDKREISSTTVSADGLEFSKTGSSPDYSIGTGSIVFEPRSGIHTWELKIDRRMDGVWIGVCTPNVSVGNCIQQSNTTSWNWRPSGETFRYSSSSKSDSKKVTSIRFEKMHIVQLTLDTATGELSFRNTTTGLEAHTMTGVTMAVVPFVCFDYDSKAVIVSQGSARWLDAAEAAWESGKIQLDRIALPPKGWGPGHDEQLARLLGTVDPDCTADVSTISGLFSGGKSGSLALSRAPLLQGVPIPVLLRRRTLLIRYSSLVVRILPLLNLQGRGAAATKPVRQLRSLILPGHKKVFIGRILSRVRLRAANGDSSIPNFKISRAAFLSGRETSADGSESITYQTYAQLKKNNAVTGKDHLYCGKELWWQIEFIGEGIQDCGGGFRESISNISDELMSPGTPLFVPVRNADAGAGSLQDAWVPNPSCHDFHIYEWIGRLCAAAIVSDESLVLRLPPLVWKLLGGAEVGQEDLEEVDVYFCNLMKMVGGGVAGLGGAWGGDSYTAPTGTVEPVTPELIEAYGLNFGPLVLSDGSTTPPLLPGGASIDVTFENRRDFVRLATRARLEESKAQVAAMRKGLIAIIPPPVVRMWTAVELERQVCGDPKISVEAIRSTARFDISQNAPELGYLWEALEELSNEERSLFLRFVSGRARLPVSIKFQSGGNHDSLPRSATCFNSLTLPKYRSKVECLEKLRIAIHMGLTIDTDTHRSSETFELGGGGAVRP